MALVTGSKYQVFVKDLAEGVHDFSAPADDLRLILSNTAPDAAADEVLADAAEIAAGGGYSAGGFLLTNRTILTGGVGICHVEGLSAWQEQLAFRATATVGPFQYVILYNNTPSTPLKPLICYWALGVAKTMITGDWFEIRLNGWAGPQGNFSYEPVIAIQ